MSEELEIVKVEGRTGCDETRMLATLLVRSDLEACHTSHTCNILAP